MPEVYISEGPGNIKRAFNNILSRIAQSGYLYKIFENHLPYLHNITFI